MTKRIFSLLTAGILTFGLSVFAQGQSSSTSGQSGGTAQSESGAGKIKHARHSKKDTQAGARSATQEGSAGTASSSSISAKDKQFMTKAAEGGLAEVQLGQLATEKAQNNDVKRFGQMMVDDHGKGNDQLKSVAEQKGVTLPTDLSAKDKAEKDRLSKLSGDAFDKAYMRHMVMDHKKDVAEFKRESTAAKDNDVKNFASQTLPTLQKHLERAQQLAGGSGSAADKQSKAPAKRKGKKSAASASR